MLSDSQRKEELDFTKVRDFNIVRDGYKWSRQGYKMLYLGSCKSHIYKYTGWFIQLLPLPFSVQKTKARCSYPEPLFFLSQKASGFLQVIFLFGPENEEDQMNKPHDSITKVQGQTDLEEFLMSSLHISLYLHAILLVSNKSAAL